MRTLLAFAAVLLFAVPAQAGVYIVEAVGTFSSDTDASSVTLPSAPFKFQATITAPVPDGGPSSFSNASYVLDGALVIAPAIDLIAFYSSSNSGLFDIIFNDGSGLSLLGPQIFDFSGELVPGVYQTSSLLGFPFAAGSATVTVRPLSVVPEPSTLAGAGLAAIGGFVAVRRRRVRAAA
ncbi:MAG: PEP-CTERM sorting domain-containing protein [Isosphaeraceae bacterium]|nr:PEP-CTERM sorting domain-containing protein [Isosphaeraceae bacterium]